MTQLHFAFTIDRNITAEPGEKDVYLRLYKPDETLLCKGNGNTFNFEGKSIPYSITRQIEYGGEPIAVDMYWNIEEFLPEGSYRIEIFADGYLIGRKSFTL